jgi:hypothetical protein
MFGCGYFGGVQTSGRKLSVLEQYLCELDLPFPVVIAQIKSHILCLLTFFHYMLVLNSTVASSVGVEIKTSISHLNDIQADVGNPTYWRVLCSSASI